MGSSKPCWGSWKRYLHQVRSQPQIKMSGCLNRSSHYHQQRRRAWFICSDTGPGAIWDVLRVPPHLHLLPQRVWVSHRPWVVSLALWVSPISWASQMHVGSGMNPQPIHQRSLERSLEELCGFINKAMTWGGDRTHLSECHQLLWPEKVLNQGASSPSSTYPLAIQEHYIWV